MNQMLNYLLESSICLFLFYAFYELVQKKETSFKYNRIYLLGTFLLSLIIPAINISIQSPVSVVSTVNFTNIVQLPEVTIGGEASVNNAGSFNWAIILLIAYLMGTLFFLIRFIIGLVKIIGLIKKSDTEKFIKMDEATVIPTKGQFPSCSFFSYVFWEGELEKEKLLGSEVFQHELAHIKFKHTWDLLFLEISSILLWFNPIVHFYRKAVKEVH